MHDDDDHDDEYNTYTYMVDCYGGMKGEVSVAVGRP